MERRNAGASERENPSLRYIARERTSANRRSEPGHGRFATSSSAAMSRLGPPAAFSNATDTLRRKPCAFVRCIGLPLSASTSSSSERLTRVRRSTRSHAGRGCQAGSSDRGARCVPRADLLADVAAVDVRADAGAKRRRGFRRAARSSGTRCSASSRARPARRCACVGHASMTERAAAALIERRRIHLERQAADDGRRETPRIRAPG